MKRKRTVNTNRKKCLSNNKATSLWKPSFFDFFTQLFHSLFIFYFPPHQPYLNKQNTIKQKVNIKQINFLKKFINMNKRQQEQFIYFFDELCEAEEVIDNLKIQLFHQCGSNPNALFEMLSEGNEEIIISQMRDYLTERITCSHRQLYEIFEKFDSKRNGFITREDFARQITPLGKFSLNKNRQGEMNSQIETSFLQIIIEMLKRFRIIQEARKQIAFIQPWEAFAHLDCWKKGIIGIGDLRKFYNDNDFEIGESSLKFLLHALRRRYHRNVTLELFSETLNPLQFGEYEKFAEQINKQKQKQFLKRSRNQQDAMRRSRMDNQLFEYEVQRAQRRKRAELQRQLNLQERMNFELTDYDRQQQSSIQKSLLQQQRDIRNRSLLQHEMLHKSYVQTLQESRKVKEMALLQEEQRQIRQSMARKMFQQEAALTASKQRQIIDQEIALQQQAQRERNLHRKLAYQREIDFQQSRRKIQMEQAFQRQALARDLQNERLIRLSQHESPLVMRSIKQSRIQELQHELQRTRAEMRERKERLEMEDKMRSLHTASKSMVSAFPY